MPLGKVRRARRARPHGRDRAEGLAAGTLHVVQAVLSRGFADALNDDLIGVDPTIRKAGRRASKAAPAPKRFTVWTADELRELLDSAAGEWLEAFWRRRSCRGPAEASCSASPGWASPRPPGTSRSGSRSPMRGGSTIAPWKTKGRRRTISLDATRWPRSRRTARRNSSSDSLQATPTSTVTWSSATSSVARSALND